MSAAVAEGRPTPLELVRKAAALALLLGLLLATHKLAPDPGGRVAPLLALGVFLLAGDIAADLGERLGLPHLTGYLLAGLAMGPSGLGAASHEAVAKLSMVNTLALALIALSAGAELTLPLLARAARGLAFSLLSQLLLVIPGCFLAMLALRPWLPFAQGPWAAACAAALLWAVIAASRSPSATLGVISQLRPDGPLTRHTLAVVVAFDLVVLIGFTLARSFAQVLVEPGRTLSLLTMQDLATSVLGSFACGTTLGLLVAAYLRLVGRQLLVFLLVVSYGATEFTAYFHFEALLLFLTAGFVVANVTDQGERLLEAVAAGGRVVYVVFFALAGAHLDLALLARLWPIALALAGARAAITFAASRVGSRLARDPESVRRYGWMPLVSQAGITIGMAVTVAGEFSSSFGPELSSLAIAVVGINEAIGPVLFKYALDRTGETGKANPPVHAGEDHALSDA